MVHGINHWITNNKHLIGGYKMDQENEFRFALIEGLQQSLRQQRIQCNDNIRNRALNETLEYAMNNYIEGDMATFFRQSYNLQIFVARMWINLLGKIEILSQLDESGRCENANGES